MQQHFPGVEIDWIVYEKYREILEGHPHLRNLIIFPKTVGKNPMDRCRRLVSFLKKIRQNRYDLFIDLEGQIKKGFRSSVLYLLTLLFSQACFKIGFRPRNFSMFHRMVSRSIVINKRIHLVDNLRNLLNVAGIYWPEGKYFLPISARDSLTAEALIAEEALISSKSLRILVSPFGSSIHRVWQKSKWIVILNYLAAHYPELRYYFAGSEEQHAQIADIIRACDNSVLSRSVNLAGKTSIREMVGVIQRMDLIINVDTVFTHFATVLNCPAVTLMHDYATPSFWKPLSQYSEFVVNYRRGWERLQTHTHPFNFIEPQSVITALEKVLKKIGNPQAHPLR